MPREMRRLTFSKPELVVALRENDRVCGRRIPPGEILNCKPVGEGETAVRIELAGDSNSKTWSMDIGSEEILAALIRFCISRKIPLPRGSQKSAGQTSGHICQDIHLPRRSYADRAKDRPEWWDAIRLDDET